MAAEEIPRKEKSPLGKTELESLDLTKLPVLKMSDEDTAEHIRKEISRLMEVADLDTVRICATSIKDGSTRFFSYGKGNIYAQVGIVQEWFQSMGGDFMDSPWLGEDEEGPQGPQGM